MDKFDLSPIRSMPGNPRKAYGHWWEEFYGHFSTWGPKEKQLDKETKAAYDAKYKKIEFEYIAWMDKYNPGEKLLYMDKEILAEYRQLHGGGEECEGGVCTINID